MVPDPTYSLMRSAGNTTAASALYAMGNTGYAKSPMLLRLKGSRTQIGHDYAMLLHTETSEAFKAFMNSILNSVDQTLLNLFLDFCWDRFLMKHTPSDFLSELEGMASWHASNPVAGELLSHVVARRFYTIANLPADAPNIVAMLEEDLEPSNWPWWLKDAINDIIRIIGKLNHNCDSYGVWGSRTKSGLLYTSRNLDWQTNTGIDGFKLVIIYEIDAIPAYASIGFSVGLGALAGMSTQGITTSEMNLDNSIVTFFGAPFPLRLRRVLESATDLETAKSVWNSGNNTNSFNFLIGAAKDSQALAVETIRGYSAFFSANSPVEASATYDCSGTALAECKTWTNETGQVKIGKPIPVIYFLIGLNIEIRFLITLSLSFSFFRKQFGERIMLSIRGL